MRMITKVALAGLGSIVLASGAVAAAAKVHVLALRLPDGSVEHIRYVGETPPKVVVVPAPRPVAMVPVESGWSPFSDFDRMAARMAEMDRRVDAMMRAAAAVRPSGPDSRIQAVAMGNLPPGSFQHYQFVSTSDGKRTCSRSVQITSTGANQPPKVITQTSGSCPQVARSSAPVAPKASPRPGGKSPAAAPARPVDPRQTV